MLMSHFDAIALISCALAAFGGVVLLSRSILQRRRFIHNLEQKAETINRLLAFSQTIQGAGRPEQVFPTLTQYLRTELGLSRLLILAHDPQITPPTKLIATWPIDDTAEAAGIDDIDTGMCPCLRQSLPRQFVPTESPVRCVVDAALNLRADLPAYCIPFNVGPRVRMAIHMMLPAAEQWTEHRRQLAQAYINSAQAALASLQLLAEAERQSMTDALTGLFNRRSLENLLSREVALSERHSQPLSLVMADLDKFKTINDLHGHAAGDHLLKSFADCVRITLRKTDLAFRFGGDEFVIALPQTTIVQAEQVMQKLRQAFAIVDFSQAITQLNVQPTLSIGVAERSRANNVLTMTQLLAAADQALYAAKNGERNCIRVYEPPRAA